MKICYLILAHNNPHHFERLIKAISTNKPSVFVHIDAKSDLAEFSHIDTKNVTFLKNRVSVTWGRFSMVQATLNLLNEALTNNEQHDYYCLISGSDYPLKSQTFIEHYLEVNHGKEFINLVEMPSKKASKPLTRISQYYTDVEEIQKYHIPRLLAYIIARIVNTLHLKRDYKEALQGMKPYAGSQWWMLTQGSIQHILKFVSKNPKFVDFFKNTQIPDESFFQIIIGNSVSKDKIARNVTFADWSLGKHSPAIIDDNHIQYFTNENVVADDVYGKGALFFARKFPNNSDRLIELIQHN